MKTPYIKSLVVALSLAFAVPAQAASEREELEALRATTQAILDALVEKGVLTAEAAQGLVKQAEKKGQEKAEASMKAEAASGVVRVPYIPENVKREIREQIRQEVVAQAKTEQWGNVNAVPEWVSRLKWDGDIRLRYQGDYFTNSNFPGDFFVGAPDALGSINNPVNTEGDRQRARVRTRLGLTAKVSDAISAGFRITTGNTDDPVSTNQTLGSANFNKFSLVLDRAFVKAQPWDWLTVTGGRIPNPFFSTDLVWDDDLNFDGAALTLNPMVRSDSNAKPFFTVGAFPLQEVQSSPANLARDKWLYAAQAGLDWKMGANARWRFGLAYYDYKNIAAIEDPFFDGRYEYADSVMKSRQKGNTMFEVAPQDKAGLYGLAADYSLVNLTATVDLAYFEPVHVILDGDVVKNIGYDAAKVNKLLVEPVQTQTLGWQTKVTVGWPAVQNKGDWQVFMGYRHLERDAVLDAFADSDFRLGGTNSKGYFIGGLYGLDRNTWLSAKWLSADQIVGFPFGVDVLQVDFNAKF